MKVSSHPDNNNSSVLHIEKSLWKYHGHKMFVQSSNHSVCCAYCIESEYRVFLYAKPGIEFELPVPSPQSQ